MKNTKVHHEHYVGYKRIFSHKTTSLELYMKFQKRIEEEDLILVDKLYIFCL
jgi:hypothetical protein